MLNHQNQSCRDNDVLITLSRPPLPSQSIILSRATVCGGGGGGEKVAAELLCEPAVSLSLSGRQVLPAPRTGSHWAPEKVLYYATEAREA